ncbi:MAG: hypothetical protein KGJ34_03085 [Patescibacteria group bacterium]|nr:hypothetical protein [Patescibacteria group bacterium]
MPESPKNNFHEFALRTNLFKGRPDLYFCYLKSEKIAHALMRLLPRAHEEGHNLSDILLRSATHLPSSVIRFAAGEFEESSVLVDVFELLSLVRLSVSEQILEEKAAEILALEYEGIAEKIALGKNASPFLSLEDLSVPPFTPAEDGRALLSTGKSVLKDKSSAHQGHSSYRSSQKQHERLAAILRVIIENKKVSIKDISKIIKDCSEKTIQRELNVLIDQGYIRKEGERRWSVYIPTGKTEGLISSPKEGR